jgi:hypothetical protein
VMANLLFQNAVVPNSLFMNEVIVIFTYIHNYAKFLLRSLSPSIYVNCWSDFNEIWYWWTSQKKTVEPFQFSFRLDKFNNILWAIWCYNIADPTLQHYMKTYMHFCGYLTKHLSKR